MTFAPLEEDTEESFMIDIVNKLMGQINLVLAGMKYITAGYSFMLTSGVLDRDPIHVEQVR